MPGFIKNFSRRRVVNIPEGVVWDNGTAIWDSGTAVWS